jgi:murein DD-endopeptidase / murein LD-carboxypeptidase
MTAAVQKSEMIAAAAKQQIGVTFRLHGRSADVMLDCVGLVQVALQAAGYAARAPTRYALRGDYAVMASDYLAASGLVQQAGKVIMPGDVLLVQCGPMQNHLMIAVDGGVVHAHAGLRRIVFTPGEIPWPILQIWRGSE